MTSAKKKSAESVTASPGRAGVTVTSEAARQIAAIAQREQRPSILRIVQDDEGALFMEFAPKPSVGDQLFCHAAFPAVTVCVSKKIVTWLDGATIDFRGDRFKLDLAGGGCAGCAGCCAECGGCQ
ncbi:MAG: hypothetical protein PHH13_05035 [Candidatus Peribacteraceae bacterium]|nr:hypothetical protein [Candidatus Peribacteraceae bacterium]